MAMRELVTGGAACVVPVFSSSSNPLGALANALIGFFQDSGSNFSPERLKEIPTSPTTASSPAEFYSETGNRLGVLPGSEFERPFLQPNAQGSEFIRDYRSVNDSGLSDAWEEIQRQPNKQFGAPTPPAFHGPPQHILSGYLHSFVDSSLCGIPFHPTPLPLLGLSEIEKKCIHDRSSIMAQHLFPDKNEDFLNAQVNALLSSLETEIDIRANGPVPGRFRELEDYWNESQGVLKPSVHAAEGWVSEFTQHRAEFGDPEALAHSFEQHHGANGLASEFGQAHLSSVDQMSGGGVSNLAAIEQTQMLAHTLAQNNDPKFQNSKFLQFVSKMSRGELVIDDNRVKLASSDWPTEYQQQHNKSSWAIEFVHQDVTGPNKWTNEFTTEQEPQGSFDNQWVNEFYKLNVHDWVEEFGHQVGKGALGDSSADNWANAYDEFLNEQVAAKQRSDASWGVYVFSDMNPYVGHENPMKEGQELFWKGLLSEALLALEAEVMKNTDNSEGWRLLGTAHAENDDDQQAIAAMMRAQEADPTNLEVLLALGVSHTNELEQTAALKYLYGWLHDHPKYGTLAPQELSESLYYADISAF